VIADIDYPAFLPFRLFAEQVAGELGYVRREAGRGEIETEHHAHRGVPYFQACVFTEQEYRHAEQRRY
jgi:hypothetical protein